MQPAPLRTVGATDDPIGVVPRRAPLPARLGVTAPGADQPLAVVAAGPAGAARRGVLAALLGVAPGALAVPSGSWLLVGHAGVPTRAAYVPGYRQPHAYAPDGSAGPALARPPRRVELAVAEPLPRRFALVDSPDGKLGVAGERVLRDALGRAGALLFVIAADQAFLSAELRLLAEVARSPVEVFFVVTPGASGWAPPSVAARADAAEAAVASPSGASVAAPPDGAEAAVAAHRAALLAAVPALARARWYPARPEGTDALRRDLVGWAADEGLRRASTQPPEPPGAHGKVPVLPGVEATDWAGRLDRQVRVCAQRLRQDVALELAEVHLRMVQEIVFGVGCAGLPQLLDREMEALSLLATVEGDRAARGLLDAAAGQVFGAPVPAGLRRRIIDAVRWDLARNPPDGELDRVLLITSTAGVAGLTGADAADALSGYPGGERVEVLPPFAVALSGGCWQRWRGIGGDDRGAARSWAQRALREVELELTREVSRRFEALRVSLRAVLSDAVDHGILLA
ncbi:hypothetical protein [Micromonospora okii]|uniref:hypothetical protein n=1 Tax=Micromonospora okii TaxID=1182970 RepID=UPI001E517360|nr:hypothetical protein [Micromonospora okii]